MGASWGVLEASWSVLEAPWRHLGGILGHLGASWGHLGASWGRLGASGRCLGGVLGRLGAFLLKNNEKPMKIIDFLRFLMIWEAVQGMRPMALAGGCGLRKTYIFIKNHYKPIGFLRFWDVGVSVAP